MKKKMKTLERVKEARKRLRDVAAGAHAEADAARLVAADAHEDAELALTHDLDNAFVRLDAARDVRTLLRFADDVVAARASVSLAAQAAAHAQAESERRRKALQGRARDLKLTEELYERERDSAARAEQKHEQRTSDELGATRAVLAR